MYFDLVQLYLFYFNSTHNSYLSGKLIYSDLTFSTHSLISNLYASLLANAYSNVINYIYALDSAHTSY